MCGFLSNEWIARSRIADGLPAYGKSCRSMREAAERGGEKVSVNRGFLLAVGGGA